MSRARPPIPGLLAAGALLATALAAAPLPTAEDPGCPDQGRNPNCVAPEHEADETSTPKPAGDRGQRPSSPPGRVEEAAATEPTANEPEDPQPARGADRPAVSDGAPAPQSPTATGARRSPAAGGTAPSGSTRPTAGSGSADVDGSVDTGVDPIPGALPTQVPPPPPDLGARRVVATRIEGPPGARRLVVDVTEVRARGVDGGWTVTVSGVPVVEPDVVTAGAGRGRAAALLVPRVPRAGTDRVGFGVVGQRSTDVYDGRYSGHLPFGDAPPPTPPAVITVTLFQ